VSTPGHPPSPFDSLRDKRALVDTGAGPIAFVVVYAIFGLHTAAAVAVGIGIALAVERLIRGKPVINAIAGLFGTGLAAFIAVKSGKAETYFVPKLLQQLGLFVVFAGSVVIRRPLTGYIIAQFYRADPDWVKLPPVKRVMTEYTLAWAALFGFRAAVYGVLIASGRVGWLAVASIAMGLPAFGALIFLGFRYVPRRLAQLGAPDPRHAEPEVTP
jgi:Protein of unknown function (DUF3159)